MKSRCRLAVNITAASHSFVLCFLKNSQVLNLWMATSPRMNAPDFPEDSQEKNKEMFTVSKHIFCCQSDSGKQMENVPGITNMNRTDCVGGSSALCSPSSSPWEDSPGCTRMKNGHLQPAEGRKEYISVLPLLSRLSDFFHSLPLKPKCAWNNSLCELIGCDTFLFQRHDIGNKKRIMWEKFYQVRHCVWSRKQTSGAGGCHRKNNTNSNVSCLDQYGSNIYHSIAVPADLLLVSVWLES